jgi:hypothetical protein
LHYIYTSRYWSEPPGWDNRIFGIGALDARVGYAVTGSYICHAGTDRVNHARRLLPECKRGRSLIASYTLIDIQEIDTYRFDFEPRFARSRLRHGYVFIRQRLYPSILVYAYSFHHVILLWKYSGF